MNIASTLKPSARDAAAARKEYLSFRLGDEEYAIDILRVQEIRGYDNITRIAGTPPFIKGVTNLRGVIVPIVDLRIKFELESVEYDHRTVVIVLNIGDRVVGAVVDDVKDVLSLSPDQLRPAPEFGGAMSVEYLEGLVDLDDRMLILLDIERLMNSREMALVDAMERGGAEDHGE
ncbi:chemotaxis protein CheW [Halotalea alkalilenta]|uniref:Chemotaxis protein CheW n=1 Tax=Halotalea alkalilenta TaxID=376489 RepID=A0A172YGH7_9GAMM|nr:chemotaxis protein CheW [Halotalea alkalilenta]ANF58389.1 chemotaxis protein CheW [Halotalea alkalilenta]